MNTQSSAATSWPLILIAIALVGAGISYHFTLESRFAAIEQKLDQNSIALQQYQISQETAFSSKTAALDNLSKEVDSLQASLKPLGNATQEQTQSLEDIRKQIGSLQQLQQNQQDAQKKLADYATQLEKIRHDMQVQSAQVSAPQVPAPAPAAVTPPAPAAAVAIPSTQHASIDVPLALPPHADAAIDLRPAQITVADDPSVRALPVAMPAIVSAANIR
jgi:uncharacterized protein YgfB (UPF0149 family)